MKKKFAIAGLLIVVALSFALFCGCSSEENPYIQGAPDDGYRITSLKVDIDASEGDRSMRIKEQYEFVFDRSYQISHGFYRDFALNGGEKIRDLKVYDAHDFNNEYAISHEGGDILRVKVGDPDRGVETEKPLGCTIEYTMITPEHADYPDALVLNVIGHGWTCEILKADVHMILPAQTDRQPEYYYGGWGENNRATKANGMISEDPVSGKSEYSFSVGALDSYEGFTVYYFMPEGALENHKEGGVLLILLCGLALLALTALFKFTIGKDAPITPITNYYPPKHTDSGERELPMDPLDMGYLIDNTCQGSDVTSLIFYFASKGYLEIMQADEDGDSSPFILKKVCDLPEGLPEYQYILFNKIFSFGDEVTVSELTNKTYTAVQKAQRSVKVKYAGKLYDSKAWAASIAMSLLTVVFALLSVLFAGFRISKSYINPFGLVSLVPVILTQLIGMYLIYNWLKLSERKRYALFATLFIVSAVASLLMLLAYRDVLAFAEAAVIAAVIALNCVMIPFIARRTKYYTDELNEIVGFKDFLVTAEKERLETLLEENPQYYYDILPYANVLGVSDIWQDKFEGLTLEPPMYYRGVSVFDLVLFNSLYRSSYRAYSTASVSRPSSSSRSGGGIHFGGGGGFSGGGFGGGGGGRW